MKENFIYNLQMPDFRLRLNRPRIERSNWFELQMYPVHRQADGAYGWTSLPLGTDTSTTRECLTFVVDTAIRLQQYRSRP